MEDLINSQQRSKEQGFTIIELMIATVVFSLILLLVTYGVLQIGRTYTKGVTETRTQNTARAVMDSITQDIQFYKGGTVIGSLDSANKVYVLCVGNNRYVAFMGTQLTETPANHALILDKGAGCSTSPPVPTASANSIELLTPSMRVVALDVTEQAVGLLYKVHVKIAYGDDTTLNNPGGTDASCQGGISNQFCAISDLTTIVQKRVN